MTAQLAVIGGGEYGTYHARQLLRAVSAGELAAEVLVVDRDPECRAFRELAGGVVPVLADWAAFLRVWLPSGGPDDHVIPAPLSPHLLWEWLAGEVGAAPADPPAGWRLPFEAPGPPGVRFLSAAAWTCPAACVEPAHCPVLHAPRDWDLASLLEAVARERGWEPVVFRCYHLAMGIASVPAPAIREARDRLRAAPSGTRALVATSSHCHAAVGGLRIERSG